jgi:hypothetical protein
MAVIVPADVRALVTERSVSFEVAFGGGPAGHPRTKPK